jgi:hypothetical protein
VPDRIFEHPRLLAIYDASDGAVLTSDSTLRFREREEVEADLAASGYVVDGVRDAPDRRGRELIFLADAPPDRCLTVARPATATKLRPAVPVRSWR